MIKIMIKPGGCCLNFKAIRGAYSNVTAVSDRNIPEEHQISIYYIYLLLKQ